MGFTPTFEITMSTLWFVCFLVSFVIMIWGLWIDNEEKALCLLLSGLLLMAVSLDAGLREDSKIKNARLVRHAANPA